MVKIVIMGWESFSNMIKSDMEHGIKTGSFRKEDDVIYAESIDAARKLLTPQRMKLLSIVKGRKPGSLYELAKMMDKNLKTVSTDANLLSNAGLLSLEAYKSGARKKVRPRFTARKISLELAV